MRKFIDSTNEDCGRYQGFSPKTRYSVESKWCRRELAKRWEGGAMQRNPIGGGPDRDSGPTELGLQSWTKSTLICDI